MAEGLEYAHAQGIVHRDVKPGNVLVSPDGTAKLSDLGFAGPLYGALESDPRYGRLVGTPEYFSPDQIRNPRNPTSAWDIYSLGCTLYYAVTGKVPFPGGNAADKAFAHCNLRPLNPRRINPRLSEEFTEVLGDMMAKDPAQRVASAREAQARLAPFLPGSAPAAVAVAAPIPPAEAPTVAAEPALRGDVQIIVWALVVIVVGLLLFIGTAELLRWLARHLW